MDWNWSSRTWSPWRARASSSCAECPCTTSLANLLGPTPMGQESQSPSLPVNFLQVLSISFLHSSQSKVDQLIYLNKTGTRMLKPERTYSYVEELVWDKVDMKASGTYSCRANQLQASSNPNTVVSTSFTVRGKPLNENCFMGRFQ